MSGALQSAGDARTCPLSVGNIGFMLDRLGEDCSPLQFLRELTQNSIEAIQRSGDPTGEITWDVEWNHFELQGVYKVAVIDTGDGMTGEEMVRYINQLSSSISEQAFDGNYGVGAKIAAATRNHAGLVYLSWKEGRGYMIHMWRDPATGQYGLRQLQLPDGSYQYWAPVDDALKPSAISDHGTMVVLMGNAEMDNTMRAPEGSMSPSRWIARYLNTRYFQFPSGIKVRAREGWENPRTDTDRNLLRALTGQRVYLDEHSESSGLVDVGSAVARWWILRDEKALSQNTGYIASGGHVAALYHDELYEMEHGRGGASRLQQFGVYLGYNRVVIYVEPKLDPTVRVTPNTARTQLLMNSEPLPWSEWAEQFRAALPQEISSLIAEIASGSRTRDHENSIRDRLRQYRDLFKFSRYKPTPNGALFLDEASSRPGGTPARTKETTGRTRSGKGGGGTGGTAGSMYALFVTDKEGQPASESQVEPWPQVQWISAADNTRTAGYLEDRAAAYIQETNLLQINSDFRAFEDMVGRWRKAYEHVPGVDDTIRQVVEEWFEQSLIETILGVQALDGAREWSPEDVNRALSEEALTAAVMPRYHVDVAVKRALGAKLGTLKI